ncbi:putative fasciclin-like arabinogalactan protein 20 [Tripterygium wilfordii]|uniref:putative fasciclin-like arabinogalactan protein 20 n=1 Tax=Tripterygium wilfordii TaxID=458696 RepID=UPI0018F8426A|nr:putative fasciclin-like arabinogalactan protein 20 [Tripterygium wilfordii]
MLNSIPPTHDDPPSHETPSHDTPSRDHPSHETPTRDPPTHDLECHGSSGYSFDGATRVLRSRDYSVIASFLDLQLVGLSKDITEITVFAPGDKVMAASTGNFSNGEFPSIFRRHVVPCRIIWRDLVNFKKGALLPTFLKGFAINVTKSGDNLLFNGVPATDQDMYTSKRVVIHGITGVLEVQKRGEEVARAPKSGSENGRIESKVKKVFAGLLSVSLYLVQF